MLQILAGPSLAGNFNGFDVEAQRRLQLASDEAVWKEGAPL
jgi:hypothetical protein